MGINQWWVGTQSLYIMNIFCFVQFIQNLFSLTSFTKLFTPKASNFFQILPDFLFSNGNPASFLANFCSNLHQKSESSYICSNFSPFGVVKSIFTAQTNHLKEFQFQQLSFVLNLRTLNSMNHILSFAEKGKGLDLGEEPPRTARVRVPHFEPLELIHNHGLMLVGRITNPKIQKMWAFLPFLAGHWKINTRPVCAEFGHGRFQYQFASEEDLQKVLNNRPYHFAHWMIIVQRWEPTMAP